jgi:hypothetical protein
VKNPQKISLYDKPGNPLAANIFLNIQSKFKCIKIIEKNILNERISVSRTNLFLKFIFQQMSWVLKLKEYGGNCLLGPGDLTENIWFGK